MKQIRNIKQLGTLKHITQSVRRRMHAFGPVLLTLKFRLFHLERKLRLHRFGKHLAPIITVLYDAVSGLSKLSSGNGELRTKLYVLPGFIITSLLKTRRRMAITAVALVMTTAGIIFLLQPESVSASWFNGNWAHRKPVTINHAKVTADQTNFPVLVSIQADKELAQSAQDDGDDIMFTSADGTTKLSHEIESFDGSTGKLVAWVNVPSVSSSADTVLYMYYGNQSVGSQQDVANVWDSNFELIHHMEETGSCTTASSLTDSTTNANHGTCSGSPNAIEGKLNGGRELVVADTDYIENNSVAGDIATGSVTYSAWFKLASDFSSSATVDQEIFSLANTDDSQCNAVEMWLGQSDGTLNFSVENGSCNEIIIDSGSQTSWTGGTWYYVAGTLDTGGGGMKLYVNGTQVNTDNTSARGGSASTAMRIGAWLTNQDRFGGTLDEVRISSTSRSADWITTEFNNQSSPQTFITIGDRQQKDSPILYWRFDEGAGTTAGDGSGNNNPGTLSGALWQDERLCLFDGKCLAFDGSGDNVSRDLVEVSWWNASWSKRKGIAVNNFSTALTNYQILLTVAYDADMQADFDDLRFTDSSGTALDYWIESKTDSSTAKVWVEAVSIPGGSSQIYMYYGNGSASAGSSGANTFIFFDDFSTFNTSTWTATGAQSNNGSEQTVTTGAIYSDNTVGTMPGTILESRVKWSSTTVNSMAVMGVNNTQAGEDSNANDDALVYNGMDFNSLNHTFYVNDGQLPDLARNYNIIDGTVIGSYTGNTYYIMGTHIGTSEVLIQTDRSTDIRSSPTNMTSTAYYVYFGDYHGSGAGTSNITDMTIDWTLVRKYAESVPTTSIEDEIAQGEEVKPDIEMDPATGDFSVSVWFKHNNTAPSATQTLISRSNNAVNGAGYKVYMNTSGNVCFGIDDDSTSFPEDSACSTAVYLDTKWHHAEAVKNGTSSIMLYIDGLVVSTDSSTTADSSLSGANATFYAGVDGDGTSNPWSGFLDEVRYFDYAQSADQIKATYNAKGSVKGATAVIGGNDKDANLSQGLVGYWKMDESAANSCTGGANDSCDSSGNGFDGAWSGNTAVTPGKFAGGTTYDGTGDYVTVTDPANGALDFGANQDFSVALWVKTSASPASNKPLAKTNVDTSDLGWGMYHSGADFHFKIANGSSTIYEESVTSTNVINNGSWHHVVYSFDRDGKCVGYLDGIAVTNTDCSSWATTSIANANSLVIGASGGSGLGTGGWNGQLDDIRIYNRALSGGEVSQLYDWAPGPVGHWKLDDRTGTTALDSSGNGLNGSLANGPVWSTGKINSAVSFDGTDDQITVASSIPGLSSDAGLFTVSAWVYPYSTSAGNHQIVVSGNGGYSIHIERLAGSYNACLYTGTQDLCVSSTNGVTANTWQYVTMVWDGATMYLYQDGVLKDSRSATVRSRAGTNTAFGAQTNNTPTIRFWDGKIDDVKIYDYARTPKQIIQDMGANRSMVSAGGSNPSMLGHWKFDEGYGDTAYDSGKTKLNGNLAGSGTTCPTASSSCPTWTNDGKLRKALVFDGTNDVITASNFLRSTAFTVEAWINPKTTGGLNRVLESNNFILGTAGGASPYMSFQIAGGTWGTWTTPANSINLNQWNHILVTYDGSSTTNDPVIYINGKKVSVTETQTPVSITAPTSGTLYFGNRLEGDRTFDGILDEIKYYNYLLNPQEALMSYKQNSGVVMGALSTDPDGKTASNSSARAYCPPGNNETNCDGTAGKNPAPVGHWTFDERTGATANDISGNNNNATLPSGTETPKWSAGKIGSSLDFDGSDDYISVADSPSMDMSSSWTLSSWIYLRAFPATGQWNTVMMKAQNAPYNYGMWIWETDKNLACVNGNVAEAKVDFTNYLNKWVQVTCVFDDNANTLSIYFNGNYISSASSSSAPVPNNDPFYIGKWQGGEPSNVKLDDIRLYNYVRTPAQVAWDYNRGRPVGWWKFDECTGTTAYDASGFGNNGTISIGGTGQTAVGDCSTNANTAWYNGRSGKINSALNLDGATDYMYVNDTAVLEPQTDMTVAFWIKLTQTASQAGRDFVLVDKGQDSAPWFSYFIYQNMTDNKINFIRNNSSSQEFYMNGNTALQPGVWYHVSVVVKGTRGYIYLNGQDDTLYTDTLTGTLYPSTGGLIIGSDGGGKWLNGLMDDVRVYNYALTPTQIRTLKNEDSAVRFGPRIGP